MSRPEAEIGIRPDFNQTEPVFQAGSIIISHIADNPEGLQFKTRGKLSRGELRKRPFHQLVSKGSGLWMELSQGVRKDVDYALKVALGLSTKDPLPSKLSTDDTIHDEGRKKMDAQTEELLKS